MNANLTDGATLLPNVASPDQDEFVRFTAELGDLRQGGAQFIVNVTGDSFALLVQGDPPLELGDSPCLAQSGADAQPCP